MAEHNGSTSQLLDRQMMKVELHQLLAPGDVVLTGRGSRLSGVIRAVLRSQASHALLMVTGRRALEANDHLWNMNERGGGIYVETITYACLHDDVDFIAIRRPQAVDVVAIQRWAQWKVLGTATFPSVGLVMQGTRHVGGWVRRRLPRSWRRDDVVEQFVEAIADGPHRLMCAELVYRGLLVGGVRIEISDAMFAEELAMLPEAQPEIVPSLPHLPLGLDRALAMYELLTTRRRKRSGSGDVGTTILGVLGWMQTSMTDLIRTWRDRHDEPPNGDQADFITPRELLQTSSLIDIATYERVDHHHWRRLNASVADNTATRQ